MFYISQYDRQLGKYGITDTSDGVINFYTADEIHFIVKKYGFDIKGVSKNKIEVVSMAKQVLNHGFGQIKAQVLQLVSTWNEETCLTIARQVHFVKQIKGLPLDEMQVVTASYIYPKSIEEVVLDAQKYTNNICEVNVADKNSVIDALKNNVCLVLQHKTNGALTAFVCTGSFAVSDSVYQPGFFDSVYLTKQLYNYTYNIEKVRPEIDTSSKEHNPDMLNVMSCSLRFRNDGVHHDKGNLVLSSPFYTLNLANLFKMYILDSPSQLGNTIISEFNRGKHTGMYDFDFDMWLDVLRCCQDGTNYFGNEDMFMKYVNTQTLSKPIEYSSIIKRFQKDFDYIEKLRGNGYSFWR